MITVNAALRTGLYWRESQVLELGGPLAIVRSFLQMGLWPWPILQCVSDVLCIWPIPGAISVYLSEFVDVELGFAVGVAYWFEFSSKHLSKVGAKGHENNLSSTGFPTFT